ncbi:MAG: hypothetical protein JO250_01105, partial [Armatimonadetes bacterium]|nr:hypothetical protein [Armatimonadota bacterium]
MERLYPPPFDKPAPAQYNRPMIVGHFPCPTEELHLEHTLVCGQAFRWHLDAEGWWSCPLPVTRDAGRREDTLIRVRQGAETIYYDAAPPDALATIRDYFRLDVDLAALAQEFLAADPAIGAAISRFPGLRVLRQAPTECLFSFLCTAAAPLHRIRRGIAGLCRAYGTPFGEVAGVPHYGFPSVDALAEASVAEMMTFGLGYRARYIQAAARQVAAQGGADWLLGLRQVPYAEAKAALRTLPGVGEKIADCVCLFSLDKDQAIPVDTHIRRIALRDYVDTPLSRSLTPAAYAQIGDILRARFGPR